MLTRTWPYGTEKAVDVVSVVKSPKITCIICIDPADPKQGYMCLYRPEQVEPKRGDRGRLVFTNGGPTGGYWKYFPRGDA